MRIIKFRSWDLRNNEWLYAYDKIGGFSIFGAVMALGEWLKGIPLEDWDKIIVQQYTGLKDKNGKEIYEGDIVKTNDDNPPEYSATLSTVEYSGGAFLYKPITGNFNRKETIASFIGLDIDVDDYSEVIGNIFENQELLK